LHFIAYKPAGEKMKNSAEKWANVFLSLILCSLSAGVWLFLYFTISFSADQIFVFDRPLHGVVAPLAMAALYFVIVPGATIALIVLLLVQLRR
jgi:hypothetical protein